MASQVPEVIFARQGLARLAERLGEMGTRRVMVVSTPSRRFVDRLLEELRRFEPVVFDAGRVHVPREVVEAATAALAPADTVVAIGGGSAIGVGKALKLAHPIRFAAIPTTYSGSEMTCIWGITQGTEKKTGRDPRVRPDVILYDVTLSATLPIKVTVQSLMNALAHPIGALSTGSLSGEDRAQALATAAALVRAIEDLLLEPADLRAREAALRAASAAGAAIDRGKSGAHHAAAHYFGSGLALDHGAIHSILLPQSVAHLAETQPDLVAEIERAIGCRALTSTLHDLLVRAGAPTSLDALGVDPSTTRKLLEARPDLPARMVLDAQHGLRPTGANFVLGDSPEALAVLAGPPPAHARRVVLALHGRGAEAGGIVRRMLEMTGHDPDTAVLGLRSGGNRWYGVRYNEAGAGTNPEVLAALARVESALAALGRSVPRDRISLSGFSQGACLALEYAARQGPGLAGVFAPCGARIGPPAEWAPPTKALAGMPVLLGAGAGDAWVAGDAIEATAAWFRAAGAAVEVVNHPGERHDISFRQRLRARPRPAGDAGWGNTLESEALPGALPARQNSPRLPPFGLYAEQVNGTGFTSRRAENRRSWLYRIRPSSQRRAFTPLAHPHFGAPFEGRPPAIDLTGFAPLPPPDQPRDFLDGLVTVAGAGSPSLRRGCAVHLYCANRDMENRAFYDADGDLLLVPELGAITLMTELGPLEVSPGQIVVIPRGLAFSVFLGGPLARGYLGEAYGRPFQLPERGPMGANGLAEARHFRAPHAWFEDRLAPGFTIAAKLGGQLHQATQDHSPFDVVAWHGNHVPFVYDLADFSPVGSVHFDHPDPSIFTVLSAPLDEPGAHTLDLIVFAPRWDVTLGTFRPPYFHRNPVSEVNGIVRESSPPGSPFQPGCCFLTPSLTAHGPGGETVARVRALDDAAADKASPPGAGLWFQFETALPLSLTPWAEQRRLPSWPATWGSHRSYFHPAG